MVACVRRVQFDRKAPGRVAVKRISIEAAGETLASMS